MHPSSTRVVAMVPDRCCDLVLKGGIASGVVYPGAVSEIARRFRLVGLAGTSAGAIAAALAAAAELRRRRTGTFEGFERLESLGEELASPGRLLSLFAPDSSTAGRFERVRSWAERGLGLRSKLGIGWRLRSRRSRERFLRPLVENGFGLSTGMANGRRDPRRPALTQWLTDRIDEVAGLPEGRPLTFADLRDAPMSDAERRRRREGEPAIDLRALTTCVTLGRPFEIPFRDRIFAFDPAEMRRLFPGRVVDLMVEDGETIESGLLRRDGKLPLAIDTLPVIVAVRMSLSFPFLFTMVPLWAADHHRDGDPLERHWFTDGGVTSNFPIHRFDELYPRWPTLAVNLQYTGEEREARRRRLRREGGLVFLPETRSEAVRELCRPLGTGESSLGDLFAFLGALFTSAQTWHDNAFLRLPGYRDRVAEVWLRPEEGGMNLEMPAETIRGLIDRGREAGRRLAERFAPETPARHEESEAVGNREREEGSESGGETPAAMGWDGHRWTLARSMLAGLALELRALARHVDAEAEEVAPEESLLGLLADRDRPAAYRFRSEASRAAAERVVRQLLDLGRQLEDRDPFDDGPRPPVEVGTRPPF